VSAARVAGLSPRGSQEGTEDHKLLIHLARLTGLDLVCVGKMPSINVGFSRFRARWMKACWAQLSRMIHARSSRFRARCAPVSFDPSGFVLDEWKAHPADGTDIVSFTSEPGPVLFGFNVHFAWSPHKAPGEPFTISADPLDDRLLYKELMAFASEHFMKHLSKRGVFLRERGLHILWVEGRTQLALTHSFLWAHMRKYNVILGQLPRPIALIFTFRVMGSFKQFCRFAPLMDRVVESVRIELRDAMFRV